MEEGGGKGVEGRGEGGRGGEKNEKGDGGKEGVKERVVGYEEKEKGCMGECFFFQAEDGIRD